MPQAEQDKPKIRNIDYAGHCQAMFESGNANMNKAVNGEVEMLRAMQQD